MEPNLKLKAQLSIGDEIAMGPGKADLLDAIDAAGSISAAARSMGLSYRRAWLMVDTMNRLFAAPLVQTTRGGPGGARLTEAGRSALVAYRRLEGAMRDGTAAPASALVGLLRNSGLKVSG